MAKEIDRLPAATGNRLSDDESSPHHRESQGLNDQLDDMESNGSTGDQIGGQSKYAEDETSGKREGLPRD